MIRLSRSVVGTEERDALAAVIEHGYLGMGRFTEQFETELRAYLGGEREVVCVSSGTAALQLALQACGIGPGDEVIVPALTFVASFQAVTACGARPIACDVNADTGFIDVADAEGRIGARTRALMPVHYGSAAPQLGGVYELARRHRLRVIEDAAHAFGGGLDGARGDLVCFSFDGIKNITCGEGGAVVTGDGRAAERIRDARLLAVERDTQRRYAGERSWEFDVREQGWRYHMSNLMAAIGSVQLRKLSRFAQHRRQVVRRYLAAFSDLGALQPLRLPYEEIVPHIFVVRVAGERRDALRIHLSGAGIESGVHYKPNHLLARFRTDYALPNAELLGREVISLPLHAALTVEEQQSVIGAVRAFFGGA